jgi:hypothetical protein
MRADYKGGKYKWSSPRRKYLKAIIYYTYKKLSHTNKSSTQHLRQKYTCTRTQGQLQNMD